MTKLIKEIWKGISDIGEFIVSLVVNIFSEDIFDTIIDQVYKEELNSRKLDSVSLTQTIFDKLLSNRLNTYPYYVRVEDENGYEEKVKLLNFISLRELKKQFSGDFIEIPFIYKYILIVKRGGYFLIKTRDFIDNKEIHLNQLNPRYFVSIVDKNSKKRQILTI